MIEIDKNVPLPVNRYKTKYPWRDMEVGDSFLIEGYRHGRAPVVPKGLQADGWKFTQRFEDAGLRVWRVK